MTDQLDSFSDPIPHRAISPPVAAQPAAVQRAEELVCRLLDDELDEAEYRELEELLARSASARATYTDHIQLHCALRDFFGAGPTLDGIELPL